MASWYDERGVDFRLEQYTGSRGLRGLIGDDLALASPEEDGYAEGHSFRIGIVSLYRRTER